MPLLDGRQGVETVVGRAHRVALALEQRRHRGGPIAVVVDDDHADPFVRRGGRFEGIHGGQAEAAGGAAGC